MPVPCLSHRKGEPRGDRPKEMWLLWTASFHFYMEGSLRQACGGSG